MTNNREPAPAPLFAIITVTYNASRTIERTLESIDSQTFADYEHLIIDGASTDSTLAIVRRHPNERRLVISEPDHGLYDAMNKGLGYSKGKYLIYLNAGDKFHTPDTLQLMADAIKNADTEEDPGIIYGQTAIVDDQGRFLGERHLRAPEVLSLDSFADGMVVCHQAMAVLRKIVGFFNPLYHYSADYEWCIRCLQHSRHNIGLTDTYIVDYLNEGLTTRHHFPSLMERFRIMVRYYGFFPTVGRHFHFLRRWLRRRKNKVNCQ